MTANLPKRNSGSDEFRQAERLLEQDRRLGQS